MKTDLITVKELKRDGLIFASGRTHAALWYSKT